MHGLNFDHKIQNCSEMNAVRRFEAFSLKFEQGRRQLIILLLHLEVFFLFVC